MWVRELACILEHAGCLYHVPLSMRGPVHEVSSGAVVQFWIESRV